MTPEILTAIFSLIGTLIGTLGGIVVAARLMNYRIGQLEKKVEGLTTKQDNFSERIPGIEKDIKNIYHELDEIKSDI